jgi:nucleotide-binding universal stress UspA family protein
MTTTRAKILVPLDGSELSKKVLVPVARLAEKLGATVRAIRVLDGITADRAMLHGEDPRAPAAADLERSLAPLARAGIPVGWDTYVGDAATRILQDADAQRATLIAMATHGRSGVQRWVRGSVAERVLRESAVPVLLVNPHTMGASLPIRRILVPLDGSELSAQVLPLVLDFARVHGSEVELLHVIEPGLDALASPLPASEHIETIDRFRDRLPGVEVVLRAARGEPASVILETAEREPFDLIAMSTHGRSGVARWAFGSTAENVLRAASSPLLVVRAPTRA